MSSVDFEHGSGIENIKVKCRRAIVILKANYPILFQQGNEFLEMVDVDKLVYTKAAELNPILDTKLFSEHEKNWIRESRRKAINRKTAAESRDRKKEEFLGLKFGLSDLKEEKLTLERIKIGYLKDINFYKHELEKMERERRLHRRNPRFTPL